MQKNHFKTEIIQRQRYNKRYIYLKRKELIIQTWKQKKTSLTDTETRHKRLKHKDSEEAPKSINVNECREGWEKKSKMYNS